MVVTVFSSTVDGVIAALLAPLFMSLGFFIWDMRWTVSGGSAFALNMFKCNVASIWFAIVAAIRGFSQRGSSSVFNVQSIGFLTLSSTLGIIIGDVLWLEALRLLGAKHVIVSDSLKPFAAAILGRFLLREALHPLSWVGMVLTVLGVGMVAWEGQNNLSDENELKHNCQQTIAVKKVDDNQPAAENNATQQSIALENGQVDGDETNEQPQPQANKEHGPVNEIDQIKISEQRQFNLNEYRRGYMCAALNILADSAGSLWTKKYGVGMTTWSINLIRFGFAGVVMLFVSLGMRLHRRCLISDDTKHNGTNNPGLQISDTIHIDDIGNTSSSSNTPEAAIISDKTLKWFELPTLTTKGWLQITLGVAFVTFLCPALEKFALMQITLGLCISLASIGPLYGVVMDWSIKGRRPTVIGCIGVILAVGGVTVLCTFGT